jgi:hypothetical protein
MPEPVPTSRDEQTTKAVWTTEITRDGMWPTKWRWNVQRHRRHPFELDSRGGEALTKERARRKAIRARLSMERDDVRIVDA